MAELTAKLLKEELGITRAELERVFRHELRSELSALRQALVNDLCWHGHRTTEFGRGVRLNGQECKQPAAMTQQNVIALEEYAEAKESNGAFQLKQVSRGSRRPPPSEREGGTKRDHRYQSLLSREDSDDSLESIPNMLSMASESVKEPSPNQGPSLLQRIVLSSYYDLFQCFFIMLNAAWIGYETDYGARNWQSLGSMATVVNHGFLLFFATDIALRIGAFGHGYFFWFWNNFDIMLIVAQLVQEYAESHGALEKAVSVNIFRLVRMWRIIRNVKLFRKLRTLVYSIVKSLKALMWLMLFMATLAYVFGVAVTQVVTSYKIRVGREGMEGGREVLEEYFGDLEKSMTTLYKAASDGIHWGEVAEPLTIYCNPWFDLAFGLYMSFVLFAVMNIMTAAFIESAMSAAAEEKVTTVSQELINLVAPGGGAGHINKVAFNAQMDSPQMQEYLDMLGLSVDQAKSYDLFALIDEDHSGAIEPNELVSGCMRLTGPAKAIDLAHLAAEVYWERQRGLKHRQLLEKALGLPVLPAEAEAPARGTVVASSPQPLGNPLPDASHNWPSASHGDVPSHGKASKRET